MKASQDSDAQKAFVLRQGPTAFRWLTSTGRLEISQATYFNWKKKYEGLQPPEMRRLSGLSSLKTRTQS